MKISRRHIKAATGTHEFTVEQLRGSADADACAAVSRRFAGVIDAKFAAARGDGAAIACHAGCSFCCYQRVGVLPHEAVALRHKLRDGMPREQALPIERRLLDNARRVAGLSAGEHYAAKIPCAFLVEHRCSAYDARPGTCAVYHSMSRARCAQSFEHPAGLGTPSASRPVLSELQAFGDAQIEATRAGLVDAGIEATRVELHEALRRLIEDSAEPNA